MPDITYKTIYTADDAKAIAAIDRLIAKHRELDQAVARSKAGLKSLGGDTSGLRAMLGELARVGKALKGLDGIAGASTAELKKVGQDTGAMTRAGTKAAELTAKLKEIEVQAPRTASALKGVGPGFGGGAGGHPAGGGGGAGGIGGAATRAATGTIVHRLINGTVGAYADAQQGERDYQSEVAERAIAFRDERRELAGLMGFDAPGAAVLSSSLGLMKASGMSAAEEAQFSTEYYNSAAIGRDRGNLGEAGPGRDRLEEEVRLVGARFGVRAGIDPGTAGDITGAIGTYKKINGAADVAGELAGVHYGLDQGRGRMTALMKSELSQAGSKIAAGYAANAPELAAMIGVLSGSAKSGGSAGTSYGQMSRLLNEATGPDAEFLRKIGVSDVKGDLGKLHKLDAYLKANRVADVNKHLAENGFGNQSDRNQVSFALSQLAVIDKRVEEAGRRVKDPGEFMRKNADFQAGALGQSRRAASEAEAARVERGTREEALRNLGVAGRAHRTGEQSFTGTRFGTANARLMETLLTWAGAGDGERELDEMEGIAMLGQRFKAQGRSLAKEYPELVNQQGKMWDPLTGTGRQFDTNEVRSREVAKATAEIEQLEKAARDHQQAAGAMQQAAGAIQQAAAALNQAAGGGGAPMPPGAGKPAVVPRRP